MSYHVVSRVMARILSSALLSLLFWCCSVTSFSFFSFFFFFFNGLEISLIIIEFGIHHLPKER
jgi:hypothetical protein